MKFSFKRSQGNQPARKKSVAYGGGLTIAGVGAMWCAIASLLIIIAAYLAGQCYIQQLQQQRQQFNQLEAKNIATQMDALLQPYRVKGELLANDQALINLLSAGDDSALQQKQLQMQQRLPETLKVRITKAGVEKLEAGPELSFTDIELLASVETTGKSPPIEVQAVKSPEQHFAVITPIFSSAGQFIGSLMLSFSGNEITKLIGSLDVPQGFVELVQGNDATGMTLASKGNAAIKNTSVVARMPINGTHWFVDFYGKADPALAQSGLSNIYGAAGVLVISLIILSILFVRILMIAIRNDLITLNNLVFDKWSNRAKSRYLVRIKHYRDLVESILNMGDPAPITSGNKQNKAPALATALNSNIQQGNVTVKKENLDPAQQQQQVIPAHKVVPASIFKAYDIRGIVGNTLTDELVYEIGLAIGSEAEIRGQQTVIVARDGRLSGPAFAGALAKGLRDSGRDVIDIGQVPTPLLYYATYHLKTGSGVMVTGSHNPPDYNGFKIMLAGETLSGAAIQVLRKRIEGEKYSRGAGKLKSVNIIEDYIQRVSGDINVCRPIKLVLDCGNGVAGAVAPQLLRALGCDVHELYCEVDGNFPNHHPDPSQPENLKDLIMGVLEHDADIGLAFDGDGDRLGVVDSNGEIIWPDRQMMLYATDILSRNPGAEIIYDVKCSKHLGDVITKQGGRPLMWKTGHSLIKAKLKETGDLLAGEMSGHIFFKERWYGFDDALYTAARLLEILALDPRPSGEVFAALPNSINTPELNLNMAEDSHFEFMNDLMGEAQFPGARITTIDGIRADFEDGWGLVRASNTTPCLVLRFEADNALALKRIQDQFKKTMLKVKPDLKFPF